MITYLINWSCSNIFESCLQSREFSKNSKTKIFSNFFLNSKKFWRLLCLVNVFFFFCRSLRHVASYCVHVMRPSSTEVARQLLRTSLLPVGLRSRRRSPNISSASAPRVREQAPPIKTFVQPFANFLKRRA